MAGKLTWLLFWTVSAPSVTPSVARADPLCDQSYGRTGGSDPNYPLAGIVFSRSRMVLEVEVEGPAVNGDGACWALARVIASYQGTVDSGYVWIGELCGYPAVIPGARWVVPAIPTRGDAVVPTAVPVVLGSMARAKYDNFFDGPLHLVYDDLVPRLMDCTVDSSPGPFQCQLPDAAPWYGMDRELVRQWAWNDGAGRDGARIPGAEPPDGVPAEVDAIAGGVWPSWWFAAEVYDDVVRLELTHGETVDPLGHDGCRAFGSILSVSRGARTPGDRVALRVPPAQCLFVVDLDAPVTWVAILEPTDDPRSDAAVVELLPLEPMVTWASSDRRTAWAWSDVFHLERPDCPRAAAADDFERNRARYPNVPL